MDAADYVSIGRVIKPFGYKGEMKILLEKEMQEGFDQVETLFLLENGGFIPYFVESVKPTSTPGQLVLKLEGVGTKEAAVAMKGQEIYLDTGEMEWGGDSRFSFIIGYQMVDEVLGKVGIIEDVLVFPQQELARVTYQNREALVPLNEGTVMEIDKGGKRLRVKLPDGLLDIYEK